VVSFTYAQSVGKKWIRQEILSTIVKSVNKKFLTFLFLF